MGVRVLLLLSTIVSLLLLPLILCGVISILSPFLLLPQNGEFHTFVTEGPIFSQPLSVKVGRAINRDGFVFCDVLPQDYDEAAAEAEAVAAEAEAAAAAAARQASAAAAEEEEVNCLELMKAANPPPCPMDKSTLH